MKQRALFNVTGMSCAGCVAHVQQSISKIEGVQQAEVSLLEGRTLITYDDEETSPEAIKQVVDALGYKMLIGDAKLREEERLLLQRRALRRTRRHLIISLLLALVVMLLEMHPDLVGLTARMGHIISAILAGVIYFYCARDYHRRSWGQLRSLSLGMDTLISLSITVAYLFSLVRLFLLDDSEVSGIFRSSYFDVVGMIVTFVLLGKLLEERAKVRTNDALRRLVELTPDTAWVDNGLGEYVEQPAETIAPGMRILLRKGARVPVDGRLEGDALLDESSITGEPLPVHKHEGESVLSGSICMGEAVTMVAEHVGEERLLGRIISAVRMAQSSKAPIQRIADRVSAIFVPAILLVALVTFVAWGFGGGDSPWLHALYFAISVLVIACPCALGLATPTAITVAIGRASSMGLLVRDAVALERLGSVTDLVFDKTGTLTHGAPSLIDAEWSDDRPEMKALLVAAEEHSSHPIARSLIQAFVDYRSTSELALEVTEEVGQGLRFIYQNEEYRIGNKRFVKAADVPPTFEMRNSAASIVYMTRAGVLVAQFALDDEIKEEAQQAIKALQQEAGVTVHLLSGDKSARVATVAGAVGIASAYGDQTPIDKKSFIDALHSRTDTKRVVAMVGDGVNDSPALAAADVSIAMGSGSDIANEVAMVTALSPSPMTLVKALQLSRRTKRVIYQNFFWAFAYNMMAVPLASGLFYPKWFVSPMWAAAAMAMSSLCVVLNSLRLKREL